MIIRYFVYAQQKDESIEIVEDTLKIIDGDIVLKEYLVIEPYWKIDGMYTVELGIKFNDKTKQIKSFLDNLSDYWITFGEPVDEILTSQKGQNCYIKDNRIEMINIFFELSSDSRYNDTGLQIGKL
ncbi:MAG: hypothetical protein K2O32_07910 [Acetatifactor sp.]|nr:hypothetical protein [Acetatifactor sp.]